MCENNDNVNKHRSTSLSRVGPYRFCSDGNPLTLSILLWSYLILSDPHMSKYLESKWQLFCLQKAFFLRVKPPEDRGRWHVPDKISIFSRRKQVGSVLSQEKKICFLRFLQSNQCAPRLWKSTRFIVIFSEIAGLPKCFQNAVVPTTKNPPKIEQKKKVILESWHAPLWIWNPVGTNWCFFSLAKKVLNKIWNIGNNYSQTKLCFVGCSKSPEDTKMALLMVLSILVIISKTERVFRMDGWNTSFL